MENLIDLLEIQGYSWLASKPEKGLCGIYSFIFTTAIVAGIDETGYKERWCYPCMADAKEALQQWDGVGDPPGDWIKHKGFGGDYPNPITEPQQGNIF